MEFDIYKREIELIIKQNFVEQDLYSVIASLIREQEQFKRYSLRDVSNRRRTKSGQGLEKIFYGVGGFPDYVILSEKFISEKPFREQVLGAIEAKYIGCKLEEIADNIQLKGHLLWFEKVLYTNGLVWKYYEYCSDRKHDVEQLHDELYFWRYKEKYLWKKNELKLFEQLNSLKPKWSISLISNKKMDKDKLDWKEDQWKELKNKLSDIIWDYKH